MKKRIFLWAWIVCLWVWAGQAATFAQESKWRLGVRVSPALAFSSVSDKPRGLFSLYEKETKTRVGLSVGWQVNYQFAERFSLNTGLGVSLQSFLVKTIHFSYAYLEEKTSLTLLQIPLTLQLHTNKLKGGMRARGTLGSLFHIPVGATQKVSSVDTYRDRIFTTEQKGTSAYTKLIPYFLVGAGVEWDLGNGKLDLGANYQIPLVVTTNDFLGVKEASIKMSYVTLDITYYF